jgi:hypothetical protein
MFDINTINQNKTDIKLNNNSIKADLKRLLKTGFIVADNTDFLVLKYNNSGLTRLISIKTDSIRIETKKPTKSELLLKSMEIVE